MNVIVKTNERHGLMPTAVSMLHDLRNPLTAIHGGAEMLMRSRLSGPQMERIARSIYGASVRMQELLDEFFGRCRGAENQVEPLDVRDLIAGAVERIQSLADAQSVEIVQRVPGNLILIVDRRRIQSVLINLFVNAIEAMPEGGILRVTAVPLRESVLIKVRDTGPGIAPDICGRLFEPFATAGKAQGLGLGLAVCRQAVMAEGGAIWAETELEGACFAVTLPRAIEDTRPVSC